MSFEVKKYIELDCQVCNDLKEIWLEILDKDENAIGEIRLIKPDNYELLLYKNVENIAISEEQIKKLFETARKNLV